jgi:hypothetical protein
MKMPPAAVYIFTPKEVLEALIKSANLHEGKWMLSVNFSFAAGPVGPPDNVVPGAIVGVNNFSLRRTGSDEQSSIVTDAAEVNPSVGSVNVPPT